MTDMTYTAFVVALSVAFNDNGAHLPPLPPAAAASPLLLLLPCFADVHPTVSRNAGCQRFNA